jgi:hypothetical protein
LSIKYWWFHPIPAISHLRVNATRLTVMLSLPSHFQAQLIATPKATVIVIKPMKTGEPAKILHDIATRNTPRTGPITTATQKCTDDDRRE